MRQFCPQGHDRTLTGALKKDGHCKICANKVVQKWVERNKDAVKERIRLWSKNNFARLSKVRAAYIRSAHGKYRTLVSKCNRSGKPCLIAFEDYCTLLSSGSCFYCAADVTNQAGVSLDRIDSGRWYEMGNVRLCCKRCNLMKNNLTEEAFYAQLVKICINLQLVGVKNVEPQGMGALLSISGFANHPCPTEIALRGMEEIPKGASN